MQNLPHRWKPNFGGSHDLEVVPQIAAVDRRELI
jgi:hypothetical protein